MERSSRISIVLLITAALVASEAAWAALSIKVTGSWFETIDASDLVGGPGSELKDTYESSADQVSMEVEITGAGNKDWRVDVRKVDTDWHSDLGLYVRRTSDGSGPGQVSGGTSYQQLSDTYQEFFRGSRNRRDMSLQLKLDGVSADIPCGTYLTTVYYTVVEVR
jgi:hypothetical protein